MRRLKSPAEFTYDSLFLFVHVFAWFIEQAALVTLRYWHRYSTRLHRLTTRRAHRYLLAKYHWYSSWWQRKYSRHASVIASGVFMLGALVVLLNSTSLLLAYDLSQAWNFSTPSKYTADSGAEVSGNSAHLKPQEYSSDANTAALYHCNDGSGSTIADSSSNSNALTFNGSFGTGNLNGSCTFNGTSNYASANDSASLDITGSNSIEAWTKLSSAFSANSSDTRQPIVDKGNYKLYYDNQTGKVTYELAQSNTGTWTQQGGPTGAGNQSANNSWDTDHGNVDASVWVGTKMYVGMAISSNSVTSGTAEVWQWDGTSWSKVGGDGVNGSWDSQGNSYDGVFSLTTDGTYLYAGLGDVTASGITEVWRFNPSNASWTNLAVQSSWGGTAYVSVTALAVSGSNLFAGLKFSNANGPSIYECAGCTSASPSPSWTKVAGGGTNSSWAAGSGHGSIVESMVMVNGKLVAGLGTVASELWATDPNTISWTKIGGGGTGASGQSWTTTNTAVMSLAASGTVLYAGLGTGTAGNADLWKCDMSGTCSTTSGWSQIGGDASGSSGQSWASSTFESVRSITADGSGNVYVGLGDTTNADDQVWKCTSGCTQTTGWTHIGGANLNSGWNNSTSHGEIDTLTINGNTLYAGPDTGSNPGGGEAQMWSTDLTSISWTQIGGDYVNGSWGGLYETQVSSSAVVNGKLYVGMSTSSASTPNIPTVWQWDGTSWKLIGAPGLNGAWIGVSTNSGYGITSMIGWKGNLYVGKSSIAGQNAQVWKWDGSSWTNVSGWSLQSYVWSMAVYNGNLIAAVGTGVVNQEGIYQYDGSSWTLIASNGQNGFYNSAYTVDSLVAYNGKLYAGIGNVAGRALLYAYDGSTWTKIGGQNTDQTPAAGESWYSSSGATDNGNNDVYSLVVYRGSLYAGLTNSKSNSSIWKCSAGCTLSSGWSEVGGGGLNSGWSDGIYTNIASLAIYNGELFAGMTGSAGLGDVWKYDGSSWSQVATEGLSGFPSNIETVHTLSTYAGKLWAGLGDTAKTDDTLWSYGSNAVLSSTTSSFDTNWHHIVASYDGTTMKIYIDGNLDASSNVGSISIPSNTQPLLIGSAGGSWGAGRGQPFFAGSLDEIRISNIARSGYQNVPYPTTPQAVTLASAANAASFGNPIKEYDQLVDNETANTGGGTITYRISVDNGSTWLYWDGSAWSTSASYAQANDIATANTHMLSVPVTFYGIKWQAVLSGNGSQQVTLTSVGINATSDTTAPSDPSSVLAYKAQGGTQLASNDWTNGSSPYFSWTASTDTAGSGIAGYCLYLGTTSSADPASTAGLLGSSPAYTGGHCAFMVTTNSVDMATPGYIGTAMTSSTSPYYLIVRAIDKAGNLSTSSTSFQFRFDNTLPANPAYISGPSTFINTKTATLSWPTSGGSEATDAASGIAGLQYRINSSPWYGDSHSGTGDISDLLANDGSYTTISSPDFTYIVDGTNTIYFRTWDNAGNVTTSYVTAALKVNTSGSPTEPLNVTATPSTNTANSFAFSWSAPNTFVGSASSLTYCYSVNVLPSATNCNFTSAGTTSLSANAYATQPGANTFYVVAKDESGNINYAAYGSATFTANTSAPGMPTNNSIVDVSLKSTSQWRLALTWSAPSDTGAGIASYKIYRSTDNQGFAQVGSSSSTTYIDANLSQVSYYYYIKACDSANNCGAASDTVSMLPTGRYTSPANLVSGPSVSNISATKATITWATDRVSDSSVAFSTTSGKYNQLEVSTSDQETPHTITLTNLAPGTTYYYVAKWTDVDGNTGQSGEQTFTTSPPPQLSEVSATDVNLHDATIRFTIANSSSATIVYGLTDSFGATKKINTSSTKSTYNIPLYDLSDGDKYYFRIDSTDSDGTYYKGTVIYNFSTPAAPKISDLQFQPVAGEPTSTQQVTWTTNVPSSSSVIYGVVGDSPIEQDDPAMVTSHSVIISGLADNSDYTLTVQSRDASGNLAVSDTQKFKTALDTRPPKIKNVTVEPSIRGTGAEAFGQVVVSWTTDEPATSQVAYSEGSAPSSYNSKTAEDTGLSTEHIVIVSNLPPSKIYSLVPISKDKAGNQTIGARQTTIIGHASDSVLTVILNTLQKIFGF